MREWSRYQQAIFEDVRSGHGHTVVLARAGTGKTTTIVESFKHVPKGEQVLMVAFNKAIAEELKKRAPRSVDVMTCHAFGLRVIAKALGWKGSGNRIDGDKTYGAAKELYARSPNFPREHVRVVAKVVSLAKGCLLSTPEELDCLIDDFSLIDSDEKVNRADVVADALLLLEKAKENLDTVDFDDMVWLPTVLGLRPPTYDRVFVDEAQDYTAAQVELSLKACSTIGGRVCAVGDDKQAIYRFRGADKDSIANIVTRLDAKVLPLSITYRCPKAIVRIANSVVADFEAAPEAPEGTVTEAREDEMLDRAQPGDFVVSRTNAPLVGGCLQLLRQDRRAIVRGRDIGTNLKGIVQRTKAPSVRTMLEGVEEWKRNEVARLLAKSPPQEQAAGVVADKAACIEALAEGCELVADVLGKIERLFSDANDGNAVVFSTTHKAKGLEADRVWVLRSTYNRGRGVEEDNLFYVAVTRAKRDLVLVGKEKEAAR